MKKRKTLFGVAVAGAVLAFLLLDGLALRCFSIVFILLSAFLIARNLEKNGSLGLLSSFGPTIFAATERYLSGTIPVTFVMGKLNAFLAWLGASVQLDAKLSYALCFYALFAMTLYAMTLRDNTAMGAYAGKVPPDMERQTQALRNTLHDRMVNLNRDADWNASNFVPLEAQVEVTINGKRKRRYTDLLTCLRRNRTFFSFRRLWDWVRRKPGKTVFLVLGDPGSGKSVALRKLCLDLLDEAKTAKKTPVYVNLKKWSRAWTVANPPKRQDLIDFIEKTLRGENRDTFTDAFLDHYFAQMLNEGQWYFIFDSFDEMPCLMGSGNNRELVGVISALLHDFLTSGNQSGGIIASRLYKAPSEELDAEVTLRIQEFDDMRIKTMLHQYLPHASDVVDRLFEKREDLVILCRNPFYLALLIGYIETWGTKFPTNQMDLYTQFLEGRLNRCEGMLAEEGLTKEDVQAAGRELAAFMQNSMEYGLECPTKILYRQHGGQVKWPKRLKLLEYARLCRLGGQEQTISFIHRRFQEFFLAENFRDGTIVPVYADSIRYNSGLRDALALYCEVAEEEKAKEIANYCWETVQENMRYKGNLDAPGSLELINTLYFMADAFRNHRSAIAEFADKYEQLIEDNLNKDAHFIVQLALANGMALFDQTKESLPRTVLRIFEMQNRWLNDVVMRNCRLIKKVDDRIETQFTRYFQRQDFRTFWRRFRNTDFALSKAQGFGYVRLIHGLQLAWFLLFWIIIAFCVLVWFWKSEVTLLLSNPALWVASVWSGFLQWFQAYVLPTEMESALSIAWISHITIALDVNFKLILLPFDDSDSFMNTTLRPFIIAMLFVFLYVFVKYSGSIRIIIILYTLCIIMILSDVPWIFHDCFFSFKRKIWSSDVTIVFFWIVFSIVFTITFQKNLLAGRIIWYIYLVIFIVILIQGTVPEFIDRFLDRRTVNNLPVPARMSREDLSANLAKLRTDKWKLAYLNELLDNNTKLEGDWPNGAREKFKYDDLERAMALLEYESVRTDKQSYNTVI